MFCYNTENVAVALIVKEGEILLNAVTRTL